MVQTSVIADSTNKFNKRITTFRFLCNNSTLLNLLSYKEFNISYTDISKINTPSLIEQLNNQYNIPKIWEFNDREISKSTEPYGNDNVNVKESWLYSMRKSIELVEQMFKSGVCADICNTLLEPYFLYNVILTATDFSSFFGENSPSYEFDIENKKAVFPSKREAVEWLTANNFDLPHTYLEWINHNKKDVSPQLYELAESLYDSLKQSTPLFLVDDEYHIPYKSISDKEPFFDSSVIIDSVITIHSICQNHKMALNDHETNACVYKALSKSPKNSHYFKHCAKSMTSQEFELSFNGLLKQSKDKITIPTEFMGYSENYNGFIGFKQ